MYMYMYHDRRDLGSLILIQIIVKERNHRKKIFQTIAHAQYTL